jgi:gentisate 1,2-dioxygenase
MDAKTLTTPPWPRRRPTTRPGVATGNESHYHSKKDRIFVRGIQGKYSLKDELDRLRAPAAGAQGLGNQVQRRPAGVQPPLRRAEGRHHADLPPAHRGIRPGGKSQKHGHVNEAAFYILDGEGYEIHDGIRYDWKAGDIAIVHNNCVHQHFNASNTKPARALVIKTKPMYMFMNMLFQHQVEPRPTQPAPGGEGFKVREEETNYNHAD